MPAPLLRGASAADAGAVAALHADSWRHHYRGAYSDAFLNDDVLADRLAVWSERLSRPQPGAVTILAQDSAGLQGFAHVILEHDRRWGALLDNIHVAHARKRAGIGARLFARVAAIVAEGEDASSAERASSNGLYLWVLEQNTAAQAFYEALGGSRAERAIVDAPGGVASRLAGTPHKLRYAWDAHAVRVAAKA